MPNYSRTLEIIKAKTRQTRLNQWLFPFVCLLVCVLCYGSSVTKLGFYWDDWFITYYTHFFGAEIFPQATVVDRPILGWLYTLFVSAIGESRIGWQILALSTRWLLGLSLWWLLTQLWPRRAYAAASVALLFTVYPSFRQQHIAITFGISFVIYALFFISVALMITAVRIKQWYWSITILALCVDIFTFFMAEYFYGLELLRPVILWIVLSETVHTPKTRVRKTAIFWSPYALVLAAFTLYRTITETPRGEITILSKLYINPFTAITELVKTIFADGFMVTVQAWEQTVWLVNLQEYGQATILRYVLIFLLAASLITGYILVLKTKYEQGDSRDMSFLKQWGWQPLLLGVLALLVAGIPFWITDLKMSLSFTRDRFTLPMMIGAALFIFGLIEILTYRNWQSAILIATLVGLASGMHFQNSLTYRKEWLVQKDFFWQLVWRAPDIKPGTIILTTDMPFMYNSDGSLTAPLNWIYAPNNTTFTLNYLYYDAESHLSRKKPDLYKGMPLDVTYRLTAFHGSLSQAVLAIYRPPGCLRLVDPNLDHRLPDKPRYFRDILPFSKPGLILIESDKQAQLPKHIFGPEPEHGWCYYYEKADLARQKGEWLKIVELGDQTLVTDKRFYRNNVAELVPFIEGYARSGQWATAIQLSTNAYKTWGNMQLMLCDLWLDIHKTTALDADSQAAFEKIQNKLACSIK